MNYYKCIDCWRIYDNYQLLETTRERCDCGSVRFKGSTNRFVFRLLTDFKYTIKTWVRERLNYGKEC